MQRTRHIHITGASGSGVSTLGQALASRMSYAYLDTDDFYWAPRDPPYQVKRDAPERLRLLREAFAAAPDGWVLGGSLDGWGDGLVELFDVVVFVDTPGEIRLARLWARDALRFGEAALKPGGSHHERHLAFLDWAAGYDIGNRPGRSRPRHEAWLAKRSCPVLRVDGSQPTQGLVEQLAGRIADYGPRR